MAILNAPLKPQVAPFWKTLAIVFGIGVVALTVILFVLLSLWPEPRVLSFESSGVEASRTASPRFPERGAAMRHATSLVSQRETSAGGVSDVAPTIGLLSPRGECSGLQVTACIAFSEPHSRISDRPALDCFSPRRIAAGGEGCGTDACMDATTGAAGSGVLAAPYFSRPCLAPASGVYLTTEQHQAAGMPSLADIQRRGFLNLKQTKHQS